MDQGKILLANQLCFPLYAASRLMTRRYQPYLDQLNITYPQYLVLMVLWEQDAVTVSFIGERLYLASNTLTPLLKRLEALGYIARHRSSEDERQVLIHLTESGAALEQQASCLLAPLLSEGEAQKQDVTQLKQALQMLIEQLK